MHVREIPPLPSAVVNERHGRHDADVIVAGYAAPMRQQRSGGAFRELGRGLAAFVGGIGFVTRTPGMLGWALLPASIAVGAGLTLSALGVWGVVRLSERFVAGGGGLAILGRLLFDLLFGGVVTFAAIVVALAIAQPLARAALDRIATPLDGPLSPLVRARPLQPSSGLVSSLAVALSALGVTLPGVGLLELVTLFAPEAALFTEPLAFGISALGLAWELLDHPFSRRGLTLGERLKWIRGSFFAVLGFATAAQVFLLIPGVDFFLLPIGIAGATRLFAESEEAEAAR